MIIDISNNQKQPRRGDIAMAGTFSQIYIQVVFFFFFRLDFLQ